MITFYIWMLTVDMRSVGMLMSVFKFWIYKLPEINEVAYKCG